MVEYDEPSDAAPHSTTVDFDDSIGASEAPGTAQDSGTAGLSEQPQPGQPRDESGRFAPKAAEKAPVVAPDGGLDATAAEDPAAPAALPDVRTAAPTASDASPAELAPPTGQPYTFIHRGRTNEIAGAVVQADGSLVVPSAARDRVTNLLSKGREYETETPKRFTELQQRLQQAEERAQQTDAGNRAFAELLSTELDDETYLKRALELKYALPGLRMQQLQEENAKLRGQGSPAQPAASDPHTEMIRQAEQNLPGGVATTLREFRDTSPELQGFTEQELANLHAELMQRTHLFARLATAEDEAQWGEAAIAGTPILDRGRLAREVALLAGPTIQQKQASAAKAKQDAAVAEAAKRNAAKTGKPNAPPVPGNGITVATGKAPRFKTKAEWDAWVDQ